VTTHGTSPRELLAAAEQMAGEGLEFYKAVANHVSDPDVKALFLKLAEDEAKHMGTLNRMKQHPADCLPGGEDSLVAKYIQKIVDSEVVRPVSKVGEMTRTVDGLVEAIALGMKAEKRAVVFYTKARDEATSEVAAAAFSTLIELERRHLELLRELKKRLTTDPPRKDQATT